jgi:hypothetical protein
MLACCLLVDRWRENFWMAGKLWMGGRRSLVGWRDCGLYKYMYYVKPPNWGVSEFTYSSSNMLYT